MTEVREDETEVAVGGECVGYAGGISTRRTVTVGLESFNGRTRCQPISRTTQGRAT
jgi:hypothetical protein